MPWLSPVLQRSVPKWNAHVHRSNAITPVDPSVSSPSCMPCTLQCVVVAVSHGSNWDGCISDPSMSTSSRPIHQHGPSWKERWISPIYGSNQGHGSDPSQSNLDASTTSVSSSFVSLSIHTSWCRMPSMPCALFLPPGEGWSHGWVPCIQNPP